MTTLREAHERLNLSQTSDAQFFTEWRESLPALKTAEIADLEHLKERYLYF
ncbi:MAG: hypothetical protein AAFW84_34645 [Cyanobacteria bacterium J06635_15]